MAGANLTALMLTATTTPAMYLSTVYVQQVLRFSPARASLLFPTFNLAVIAGSLAGPSVLRRIGARRALLLGFLENAAGMVLLAGLPEGPPADGVRRAVAGILGAFALMGTGLGVASVASTHAGTEAAQPAYRGAASGVLNSAAQIGTALGLAIVTPLAAATNGNLMDGYRVGFFGTCAIALAGLLPSLLISPTGRSVGRRPRSDRDSGEAPVAADPNTEQAPGPWTGQLASPEPMTEPDRSR